MSNTSVAGNTVAGSCNGNYLNYEITGHTPTYPIYDVDGNQIGTGGGNPIYGDVTYNESGTVSGNITNGSNNVYINSVKAARSGDSVNINKNYAHSRHIDSLNITGTINNSSPSVFVDGISMAYNGSSVSASGCSGVIVNQGSSNVFCR